MRPPPLLPSPALRLATHGAILLLAGLLAAPAGAVEPRDPRSLPTVVKLWGRRMGAERLAIHAQTLYLKSGGRLTALALRSGKELWSRDLGRGSCCGDDILVTDSTVVAAADGKLFLLSAADGSTRSELDLGDGISALAGPPVVALLSQSRELLAIDADSGQVTGRWKVDEPVNDLAVADGYALLSVAGADEGTVGTQAFTADTLKPVWKIDTRSALPRLERIGGRLYLERLNGDGGSGDGEFLPIDPATGRLGRPLPARRGKAIDPGWPWEIQSLPGPEGAGAGGAGGAGGPRAAVERLRRNDPETGRAVWTAELPCRVQGLARGKDVLYASCSASGNRDLLVVLSWPSGEIERFAYGLPRGKAFLAAGDLVVVASDDEVAAFSTTDFGPPEAGVSVDAEVRRILLDARGDDAPLARGEWIEERLRGLEPLGPAAYPAIVRLLPRLGPTSLVAAAAALAAGGQRAAAAALAGRLGGKLEEPPPGPGLEGWNPQFALLRTLAKLGGDAEAPAVAAVLDGKDRPGAVRREALATLAAMRSPAADRALRSFLARPLPRQPVWNPPAPPPGSLAAELPDGSRLLLFRDGYLGSPDDLWLAELDRAGRPASPVRFTGVRLPAAEEGEERRARLAGDQLEVLDGAGRKLAAFSPAQIARDRDGDGLSDLVEQRLRLDPAKADSDGDGLPDAEDPAPNARLREPVTAEQEIAAALFRQFFQLDPGPPEIAVVVSDFALEWRGRRDPTITLDAREAERFLEETGGGGAPLISIRRGEPEVVTPISGDTPGTAPSPLAPDEEVYTLTLDRRPVKAVAYRVVLRNLNAGQPGTPRLWAIRSLRPVWIGGS